MTQSHGGNIWNLSKQIGKKPEEIIDFSSSVSPLSAIRSISMSSKEIHTKIRHYPDPGYTELRRTIGEYLKVGEEQIVVGNGTTELLYILPAILKGKRALIPSPSFSEYERACKSYNLQIKNLAGKRSNNFLVQLTAVAENTNKNDIIFVSNPNSPTGSLYEKSDLLKLSDICEKRKSLLVVDEVFIDFLQDWKKLSLVTESVTRKYLVVLRSLTKFFAIPGLRLGYMVTNTALRESILSLKAPWTVNAIAEHAGVTLLKNNELIKKTRDTVAKEAKYISKILCKIPGVKLYPSHTNFFLMEILIPGLNATTMTNEFQTKGILVRDCSNFKGLSNKFIRFSIRGRKENRVLLEEISRCIEKYR